MPDSTTDTLTPQLYTLSEKLAAIEALESARRRRAVLFPALLLTAVAAFSFFSWHSVGERFNQAAFRAAVDRQRAELQPLIHREALATVEDLLPVYRDHATAAFQEIAPDLGSAAVAKLRQLPDDLAPIAQKHGEKMVAHVFERLVPQIDNAIGGLPQDQEEKLIRDAVAAITRDVQARGELLAKSQSERLEHILNSFDLPPADPHADLAEQQRAFLHLLLLYADHQLMIGSDPAAHAEPADLPAQVGLAR